MKPVFKCDYCNFMGTESEVAEHEVTCLDNYDRKSCYTCAHMKYKSNFGFSCAKGKDIPDGHLYEFCGDHERKESSDTPLSSLFGNLFGGIK